MHVFAALSSPTRGVSGCVITEKVFLARAQEQYVSVAVDKPAELVVRAPVSVTKRPHRSPQQLSAPCAVHHLRISFTQQHTYRSANWEGQGVTSLIRLSSSTRGFSKSSTVVFCARSVIGPKRENKVCNHSRPPLGPFGASGGFFWAWEVSPLRACRCSELQLLQGPGEDCPCSPGPPARRGDPAEYGEPGQLIPAL